MLNYTSMFFCIPILESTDSDFTLTNEQVICNLKYYPKLSKYVMDSSDFD